MPLRILPPDTEKRKAKRGQTGGGRTSSWKRPYKDYTKIKHTNLIKTSTGKKGQIQEQSGAPGGEKKLHDKSMKRLNELQKLKSREGTRMTSGAQKKRKEHLQSGGYKAGGRIGLKSGTKKLGRKGFTGIESLHEQLGGGVKRKPHSTKKGRIASGKRRLGRLKQKAMSDYHDMTWAGPDREKGKPHSSQEGQIATGRRNFRKALQRQAGGAKPLRAKHGLGSLVKGAKKIISKLKPKGVFKPKPKEVDVDKLLKNLGDEIKAQPIPHRIQKKIKELQKSYGPHARNKESKKVFKTVQGKAAGGRIRRGHGGSAAQQHYLQHGYGPHKLKMAKASDKALRGNKLTKKA